MRIGESGACKRKDCEHWHGVQQRCVGEGDPLFRLPGDKKEKDSEKEAKRHARAPQGRPNVVIVFPSSSRSVAWIRE